MTQIKVDTITDAAGTGKPDLSDGVTVNSAALSSINVAQYTSSASEPSSPKNGALWWDSSNSKPMIYVAGEWKEVELGVSAGGVSWYGDRAIVAGGQASSGASNVIDYFTIATTGNATDFGDLTTGGYGIAGCGDGTYGLTGGGYTSTRSSKIDYVTIATPSDATVFGSLISAKYNLASASDTTRALWAGGYISSQQNVIEYVTMVTTGDSTDFGDLTSARNRPVGTGDGTYATFSGGQQNNNVIDYVTVQTTGNATDFGDLTVGRYSAGSTSGSSS